MKQRREDVNVSSFFDYVQDVKQTKKKPFLRMASFV